MKVCWLSNYYSPYKLKLFEQLSKQIELTAIMLGGSEGENRNSEWVLNENHNFKVILIDDNYKQTIKKLAQENDIFIDSMYCTSYGYFGVSAFRKENKKTVMYADGGIAKDRGFFINKAMSYLMNRHDYFFSSSVVTNDYFKYYGVEESKIFTYRFTSLTKQDLIDNKALINHKQEFRKELNIDDKFTIISVGQPIDRKGFDILLNSYIKTNKTDDINLYIVGGKPQENVRKIVEDNSLSNVYFIDLITSDELKKYYAASDIFVLCTREDIWGLVIEEAMSFGLPVITSDNCVAGLHFNKLNNSVLINGVKDTDGYSKDIVKLYENKDYLKQKSMESLSSIEEYSIENSACDLITILNNI